MRLTLTLLSIFFVTSSFAQHIQQGIDAFVSDSRLVGASIGIDVLNLETGESVGSYRSNISLIPASTQKLITTAASLDLLGPDALFETELLGKGTIREGVLHGDIYIIGGGDPTLASPTMPDGLEKSELLQQWVKSIKAAGIREINGMILGDDSYFGSTGVAMDWPWADLGNYYGAGSYGLNWHDNLYYLDLAQRQQLGARPLIQRTRPEITDLVINNELRTAERGSGDNAYIYGAPFNYHNYLRGTIPAGTGRFTVKGSIPDPARQAATELHLALEAAGIKITLPPSSVRNFSGRTTGNKIFFHKHQSPDIEAIAKRTNFKSVNLYAETLLRAINKSKGLEEHELAETGLVTDYLQNQLNLDISTVQLLDGSGLSPRNYFPAAFMTAFLKAKSDDEVFRSTIPVAGRSGSMRRRLKGTVAEGRLYSKSGSLNGARAFAGYAFPSDGRKLAFCIMVNNYTVSSAELSRLLYKFQLLLCQPEK